MSAKSAKPGLRQHAAFLIHGYARTGGKDNRRQQAARMRTFVEHCTALGAKSFAQIGKQHVIRYWKAHRELSPATAYSHWLAIRELWRLAGKPGEPPKPRTDAPANATIPQANALREAGTCSDQATPCDSRHASERDSKR
jgi:hypothetical protein